MKNKIIEALKALRPGWIIIEGETSIEFRPENDPEKVGYYASLTYEPTSDDYLNMLINMVCLDHEKDSKYKEPKVVGNSYWFEGGRFIIPIKEFNEAMKRVLAEDKGMGIIKSEGGESEI